MVVSNWQGMRRCNVGRFVNENGRVLISWYYFKNSWWNKRGWLIQFDGPGRQGQKIHTTVWLCDVLLKHVDKGAINFADFKQHLPSANFPPMVDTLYWTHIFEDTKYPKIYVMAPIKFKCEREKNLMFDVNTTKEEINN